MHSFLSNSKNDRVDGKKIKMDVWDTAGQEEFKNIRKMGYDNTVTFQKKFL